MIGNEFTCARPDCDVVSRKTTHNQKYCSNDCCREETNRRLKANYHERTAIKRGKKRACSVCALPLSRYNEGHMCGGCESQKLKSNKGEANSLIDSVSWL